MYIVVFDILYVKKNVSDVKLRFTEGEDVPEDPREMPSKPSGTTPFGVLLIVGLGVALGVAVGVFFLCLVIVCMRK